MPLVGMLFGAVAGLFWTWWAWIPGVILRWIVQPQWFDHAYTIGDLGLWIAFVGIMLCALIGLFGGSIAGTDRLRHSW